MSDDDVATHGGELSVVLVDMDHISGKSTLYRSDGKVAELPAESLSSGPIARSRWIPGASGLLLTTTSGDDILIELPTINDPAPLSGRLVVYLDQNAWSKVALALYDADRLPNEEADAALWLASLVEESKVVLPFSSGNLNETSHWGDGARRYRLALTIARLSRGWQMLDPLEIRLAEMRAMLARYVGKSGFSLPSVWTLAPNAVFGSRVQGIDIESIGTEIEVPIESIITIFGTLSAILDKDPIERDDPAGWSTPWSRLAQKFRGLDLSKERAELAVHTLFMNDAAKEFAQAALSVEATPSQFKEWIFGQSRSDIADMPALGLAREVIFLKVRNSTAAWKANDLTDIFYLVQAAGYADAVVGERSFVALLEQAQRRLQRPPNAYRTIAELRASGLLNQTKQARKPDDGSPTVAGP